MAKPKGSLIDLIEKMSIKHATGKAAFEQQVKDLTADDTAKDKVMSTKYKKVNDLDTQLSLRKSPNKAHLYVEQLEKYISDQMAKHSTDVFTAISQFNTAMLTLTEQTHSTS